MKKKKLPRQLLFELLSKEMYFFVIPKLKLKISFPTVTPNQFVIFLQNQITLHIPTHPNHETGLIQFIAILANTIFCLFQPKLEIDTLAWATMTNYFLIMPII